MQLKYCRNKCLRFSDVGKTVHSPQFFRKIVGVEHPPVRAAILVSTVPDLLWRATDGFRESPPALTAKNPGARPLGKFETKMIGKRSIPRILGKIGE